MLKKIHAFGRDESGVTAIGNGLVAALVLLAAIAALRGIGPFLLDLVR
jgi:Flp pilus assembly pilin Flp